MARVRHMPLSGHDRIPDREPRGAPNLGERAIEAWRGPSKLCERHPPKQVIETLLRVGCGAVGSAASARRKADRPMPLVVPLLPMTLISVATGDSQALCNGNHGGRSLKFRRASRGLLRLTLRAAPPQRASPAPRSGAGVAFAALA